MHFKMLFFFNIYRKKLVCATSVSINKLFSAWFKTWTASQFVQSSLKDLPLIANESKNCVISIS